MASARQESHQHLANLGFVVDDQNRLAGGVARGRARAVLGHLRNDAQLTRRLGEVVFLDVFTA